MSLQLCEWYRSGLAKFGCLDSVEWNGGPEWWNGMVDWNGGMEWWTGTVEWNGLIGISSSCQLFAVTTQQFVYTSVGQ